MINFAKKSFMKILIAGAGNVGSFLIKMFTEYDHDVTLIDNDIEKLQEVAAHYDIQTIHGTMTSIQVLEQAEVDEVDMFIAVSNYQENNILGCIIAKNRGVSLTIARVENEEYTEPENNTMLKNLGVDHLIYPEILVKDEILNYLQFPSIIKSIPIASGHLFLFSLRAADNKWLSNKQLREIIKDFPHLNARIIAILRKDKTIIPKGNDFILPEDIIYVITDKEGIGKVQEELGLSAEKVKKVMILGGSKVGVKLAKALEKNCYVKIFEKEKEKSYEIANELQDTLVIHSEARDADFLLDEGIDDTDAFIAVTGNSELNLLSCMLAKRLGVKRTFAEVENTDYLDLVQKLDVDYVINKKFTAASKIFAHTVDAKVLNMYFFADIDAQVIELIVDENALITQGKIKDLDFPKSAIIGGLMRKEYTEIVTGESQILTGDKVVIFCQTQDIERIVKWFK